MFQKILLIAVLLCSLSAADTNKWLGGDSGSETDANVAENWSLGTVPVSGETIVFDDTAGEDTFGDKYDCNWANWATGVLAAAGVEVTSAYDGDIGSTTDIWEIACEYSGTEYDFIYRGAGNCYVKLKDVDANDACNRLVVNSAGGLFIYSDDGGTGGTRNNSWGDVFIYAGAVNFEPNTVLESLYVDSGTLIADTNCLIPDGNAVDIKQKGGTVYWDSELGDVTEIYGGVFYWGSSGNAGSVAALECDLLKVYGGTFYWRIQPVSGTSVLKQFFVYSGGTLDASTTIGAAGAKQIGSGAGEISELWYGGTAKFNNGNSNISFGSGSSIFFVSGSLYPPENEYISW